MGAFSQDGSERLQDLPLADELSVGELAAPRDSEPLFHGRTRVAVEALLIGERIDLRELEHAQRLARAPLTIRAGDHGVAVLFRYGAVVLFGLSPVERASFLTHLAPFVFQPAGKPECETTEIWVQPEQPEGVGNGVISLRQSSPERLQVVADALAKSVVLASCESSVAEVFERIEPLAARLQKKGQAGRQSKELLYHIGGALLIQHRTVGRVETVEKPDLLWEHPELERLYHRLKDEYELRDRQVALDDKLTLISRTAEILLELLQNKRSLRVEWYIVILIVVEILLTLYEMFLH